VLYETTLFWTGATPADRPDVVGRNDTASLMTADLAAEIPHLKITTLAAASGDHPARTSIALALIAALHLLFRRRSL